MRLRAPAGSEACGSPFWAAAGRWAGYSGDISPRSGNDVTLIDVSKPAVEAINASGLTIEEKDGSQPVIRVPASTEPAKVGPVDLIINFVKCYHTEAAVRPPRR